jgi:hypothetical protein
MSSSVSNDRPTATATQPELCRVYHLSPLIRLTLLLFYSALTLPLPFLARVTRSPLSPTLVAIALLAGALLLYATLTERVITDNHGIRVAYALWVPKLWRSGWSLKWSEIKALKPRSTGQGGIVYYFLTQADEARLLPVRIAGFAKLVATVEAKTQLDTRDVRPLAQPWMYFILLGLTILLLLVDGWTIWTALTLPTLAT